MNHHHRLQPLRPVRAQCALDPVGLHAPAPVAFDEFDIEPEALGHTPPQGREHAAVEHQHGIAGRQRVHDSGLPGAGGRSRIHGDRTRSVEQPAYARDQFQRHFRELRTPMVDGGHRHGGEHPVGYVGGSGNLQEVAAAAGAAAGELGHGGYRIQRGKERQGYHAEASVQGCRTPQPPGCPSREIHEPPGCPGHEIPEPPGCRSRDMPQLSGRRSRRRACE